MALSALTPSFLGKPIEICIVTPSHKRTIAALSALGIGPWRIYTCSPKNTTAQTYRNKPSAYTIRFCYAAITPSDPNSMIYEVIEPVSGPTIFQEFLDEKGEGLHHVAYDCNGIAMEERVRAFKERGFECVQSGKWMVGGENEFAFFEKREGGLGLGLGTCFETIQFEEGWDWPEPDEWFPAKEEEEKKDGEKI